jgi:molybdate transport system permease protein
MEFDWTPLLLTFKLALVTTAILFVLCIPLAYWLAYSKTRFKFFFEALVAMPLVLPPSVLGFYLLMLLSQNGVIGSFFIDTFDFRLAFSFTGIVIGSVIYSLPFMVHPIQNGFENLAPSLKEASYTLGKSRWQTLWKVLLPNMKPAVITGLVLSFAHTIGEFGVVLLIGGQLPGTKVASIEIYNLASAHQFSEAHVYSFVLFAISLTILMLVFFFNKKMIKPLT